MAALTVTTSMAVQLSSQASGENLPVNKGYVVVENSDGVTVNEIKTNLTKSCVDLEELWVNAIRGN